MNNTRIVNQLAYQVRPPDRSDLPTGPTSKRGQSILEVLIALAAILLVITAIVRGIVVSVKSSNYSKLTAQAANLSQEGMENMRIYRDAGWLVFWSKVDGTNHELPDITPGSPNSCPTSSNPNIAGTPFVRCVELIEEIPPGDQTKAKVVVRVYWQDSTGDHKSELVTYFTNWN